MTSGNMLISRKVTYNTKQEQFVLVTVKTGKIEFPTAVLYQPAFCGKPIGYQAIKSSHGSKQHGAH